MTVIRSFPSIFFCSAKETIMTANKYLAVILAIGLLVASVGFVIGG